MIDVLTLLILMIASASVWIAWETWHDPLHPAIVTGPMFIFLYVLMPSLLRSRGALVDFLTLDDMSHVQTINLIGVTAFLGGTFFSKPASRAVSQLREIPHSARKKLLGYALLTGTIGYAAWLRTINNSGGFTSVFSNSYASGWDENGYVRDAQFLLFTAILLALLSAIGRRIRYTHVLLVILFALPWAIQGLLGARRGPTFLVLVITASGYMLTRRLRAPLMAILFGGIVLGIGLLLLVVNRSGIFLGSDQEMSLDISEAVSGAHGGNEFIYGAGTILNAERSEYYWGRRYLTYLLIRPIPSVWWPTKYEDVGMAQLLKNAGTAGSGFQNTLTWEGADGAAPGVVADLWVEFSWAAPLALFSLGWLYGYAWCRGLDGGIWGAQFAILLALSMYLILQTFEAIVVRALITSVPMWCCWHFSHNARKRLPSHRLI